MKTGSVLPRAGGPASCGTAEPVAPVPGADPAISIVGWGSAPAMLTAGAHKGLGFGEASESFAPASDNTTHPEGRRRCAALRPRRVLGISLARDCPPLASLCEPGQGRLRDTADQEGGRRHVNHDHDRHAHQRLRGPGGG